MSWKILLSPPEVSEVERDFLIGAFDSGWIAPAGPDLDAFEAELTQFTGAAAVVGLSSGSAAMHMAVMAAGVQAGQEVLVSDLTFAASAFAVSHVGALPVFVDCEPATWHMDPNLLADELARRAHDGTLPAAVIVVDLYGSVADYGRLVPLCAQYGVPLIEDAAEALGAHRDGRSAGRFGGSGVLSFNGNKILTTGGGGALMSDDAALVSHARYLSMQARQPVLHFEHHDTGFNYRMGNLNAAVGRGQLRTLPDRIAQRRRVRLGYEQHLAPLGGIEFQAIPEGCEPNHWLTTIVIDTPVFGATAPQVLAALHAAGIEARPAFKPMHLQPVFAGAKRVGGTGLGETGLGEMVSAGLFERSVCLPSGGRLTDADVAWVCEVIASARQSE